MRSSAAPPSNNPRVLVVDDDAVMRSLLRKLLELSASKYYVADTLDGEGAKRLVEENEYDCIVLDHVLPDMTGLEFLHWLRSRDIRTPVVVFTGFGDEALAVEMMKAGANDYLSKVGFSSDRFIRAVRNAIEASARKAEI